jgi:outer membrane receptor for ferrienterochelin and colicin
LAAQCNIQTGGAADLKPELSITRSLGIVVTPTFVKHLSFTVDYFDISIDGAIGILPVATVFNNCFATNDANSAACQGIVRSSDGTGGLSGQNSDGSANGYLVDFNQNTGYLRTKGVDFQADYRIRLADLGMGNHGQFIWNYNATWTEAFIQQAAPGTPAYDCVGFYGTTCGIPDPRYRHKLRMTWQTPSGLALSADWRYFGGVALDSNSGYKSLNNNGTAIPNLPDAYIGDKQYLDLSGTYQLPFKSSNITLRAGVSNVLGQAPPTVDTGTQGISSPPFGNGNTFPNVYDALGRVLFVGVTADF